MISFREIKEKAQRGDYVRVAEICNCSIKTVRAVVDGYRLDNYFIQYTFAQIMTHRKELKEKIEFLQNKKTSNE